jgi:hypothetical protein
MGSFSLGTLLNMHKFCFFLYFEAILELPTFELTAC